MAVVDAVMRALLNSCMLSTPLNKQQKEAKVECDWQLAWLLMFVSASGSEVG